MTNRSKPAELSKPVTRRTAAPLYRYGRRLLVTLEPPDTLALQLEGHATVYRIPLARVFLWVIGLAALGQPLPRKR